MFLTIDMKNSYRDGSNAGFDNAIERLKDVLIEISDIGFREEYVCDLIADLMDITYRKGNI